jgi:tryptophanyl-tRNA synthetase
MFTDPDHLRVEDPGKVEGNVVFTYLDAFDEDRDTVEALKARYRRGGLGDMVVKRRLEEILQALIAPIRERRAELAADPGPVLDAIRAGTERGRAVTERTKAEVAEALGLFRL